ncbi:uncharacterized protein FOMMEDRAFT_23887 [Fomitiporia mediterranea MF3/22]|uniref:uncharacterized protein n=1 Tax=Fomitiporia mediterranea (strain MF3/22) TaxID=694068 RepID=UPI0004408FCA|nr:uncharacterized protein FOMMEDRAFT_23887 [Fomitiporia mediterranea MF3/22]EJC97828.1 hypothetical protein FOMMEDRAFT_23887 [Fomitiporia mediterranea MF3/22]
MAGTPSDSRAAFAVAPDRPDGELLNIGQQCSAVQQKCTVVDYLPFVCDHCNKRFCQDHRLPESHSCEKWDANAADRRALECPLCSELIAIPPGEDPNIKLGRHVDEECVVMTGKAAKKSTTPSCAKARCGKPLWQPITCTNCRKQFCAPHRYPTEHGCSAVVTPAPSSASTKHANPLANISQQTSVKSAAAMAAIKRSLASTNLGNTTPSSSPSTVQPAPALAAASSSSSSTSTGTSKPKIPFSAKDRRANSERKSQLKALEDRQRKGLLSAQDEERLRALQESAKEEKECVVM